MKSLCMDISLTMQITISTMSAKHLPTVVEHLADFKGTNLLADIGNAQLLCVRLHGRLEYQEIVIDIPGIFCICPYDVRPQA